MEEYRKGLENSKVFMLGRENHPDEGKKGGDAEVEMSRVKSTRMGFKKKPAMKPSGGDKDVGEGKKVH